MGEFWLWLEVDGRWWHTQVAIRFAVLEASLNDLNVWWNYYHMSYPLWKQGKSTITPHEQWKKLSCSEYIGDCTTQLNGVYNKPLSWSLLNFMAHMICWNCICCHRIPASLGWNLDLIMFITPPSQCKTLVDIPGRCCFPEFSDLRHFHNGKKKFQTEFDPGIWHGPFQMQSFWELGPHRFVCSF